MQQHEVVQELLDLAPMHACYVRTQTAYPRLGEQNHGRDHHPGPKLATTECYTQETNPESTSKASKIEVKLQKAGCNSQPEANWVELHSKMKLPTFSVGCEPRSRVIILYSKCPIHNPKSLI